MTRNAAGHISPTILWWGRFDINYSRNRILRQLLQELGFSLVDFIPKSSAFGGLQSAFTRFGHVDAVWVPCFRQTDYKAARQYAARHSVPLIFDPLISAWDKAVFERKKFAEDSAKSQKLLQWEQSLFSSADLVLADTTLHADFYTGQLNSPADKTVVIPVGAEEELFTVQPFPEDTNTVEVLFYGSFINLQGPETIVKAATLLPDIKFTLLGEGPLKKSCQEHAQGHASIHFENWIDYKTLPERIGKAHILLGIFGDSPKASRVIPNKVYQSLACGRPTITRYSEAYEEEMRNTEQGLFFVEPASPELLADKITELLSAPDKLMQHAQDAHKTYMKHFSQASPKIDLQQALKRIL
jgi:glycosyltransferase involved in cell wall biosynthesis